jgi:uncharacterized membrane protein YgcG
MKAPSVSSAKSVFARLPSNIYANALNAYGTYDRMARYSDFSEMEHEPLISAALDLYADETVSQDDKGQVLHIYSENPKVKEILEDLFYETVNVEFNLTPWVRNLCKYGDFFLFNDVHPEYGVINLFPIPVNEIEREEGFDPNDPFAVRFRWSTQGNAALQNWQVTHLRLMGNDSFLPYGTSVLDAARRVWRQLILIEDAMLVYRVVRSPERRVFYIDVGNVPPEDIPSFMEQAQSTLKKSQVVDKTTGRVDLRYNPLSVDEDYFIPVRGGESGTRIDSLAGGTNVSAIEDVEYIQKKLFGALKVPKAYLGYDEALSSKATLAQEDIRFSRTISRIQRVVLAELNKIAIIHLYCHGFDGDDLLDFDLRLSNPSTIAQQQKLELYRTQFEIIASGQGAEGMFDRNFLRKTVMGLSDEQIEQIEKGKIDDKRRDLVIEDMTGEEGGGDDGGGGFGGGGGGGGFGGGGGGFGGGDLDLGDEAGDEPTDGGDEGGGGGLDGGDLENDEGGDEPTDGGDDGEETDEDNIFAGAPRGSGKSLLTSDEDVKLSAGLDGGVIDLPAGAPKKVTKDDDKSDKPPIKTQLGRSIYNRGRHRTHGASKTHMPDFNAMVSYDKDALGPFDHDFFSGSPMKFETKARLPRRNISEGFVASEVGGLIRGLRSLRSLRETLEMNRSSDELDIDIDSESDNG